MIVGIGTDIVQVKRFCQWQNYPLKKLLRIFTQEEIDYCLKNKMKSAQRFAARFAAKEAFYKALCSDLEINFSFLSMCKQIYVKNKNFVPIIKIKSHTIEALLSGLQIHLSMSHTNEIATAFVVIEKI